MSKGTTGTAPGTNSAAIPRRAAAASIPHIHVFVFLDHHRHPRQPAGPRPGPFGGPGHGSGKRRADGPRAHTQDEGRLGQGRLPRHLRRRGRLRQGTGTGPGLGRDRRGRAQPEGPANVPSGRPDDRRGAGARGRAGRPDQPGRDRPGRPARGRPDRHGQSEAAGAPATLPAGSALHGHPREHRYEVEEAGRRGRAAWTGRTAWTGRPARTGRDRTGRGGPAAAGLGGPHIRTAVPRSLHAGRRPGGPRDRNPAGR